MSAGCGARAILPITGERLELIAKCEAAWRGRHEALCRERNAFEAMEGRRYVGEVEFRERNRSLIEAKKRASDFRCEVCDLSFEEDYGPIGKGYIVAHHTLPIGKRRGSSSMKPPKHCAGVLKLSRHAPQAGPPAHSIRPADHPKQVEFGACGRDACGQVLEPQSEIAPSPPRTTPKISPKIPIFTADRTPFGCNNNDRPDGRQQATPGKATRP